MPPKTVTCSVCGQEVLKSQTYATGEKDSEGNPLRACKEHEGVVEKAQELREKQTEKAQQTLKKLRERPWEKEHESWQESAQEAWEHCWCCGQKGINLQEFYQLQLIALEKGRILGENNPFSDKIPGLLKGLMEELGVKCVLHRFQMDEKMQKQYEEWKNRVEPKRRVLCQWGMIHLCFECQKRTGIEFPLKESLPEVDLKTLMLIGSAYEGSNEQQTVKALAEASVKKDNYNRAQRN